MILINKKLNFYGVRSQKDRDCTILCIFRTIIPQIIIAPVFVFLFRMYTFDSP
jgi:hypothetical protein